MSAMESLKGWLNQKIANILGDLQEQEPIEDPGPMRAGCRIFFMVILLLGFSLMLVFTFIDAPDARVVQIYRLALGDENHAFPSCFLYDSRNSTSCKKWSKAKFPEGIPVSCPCTNKSFPWENFVKFYILHENSKDWKMEFKAAESLPLVSPPYDYLHHGDDFTESLPLVSPPYDYLHHGDDFTESSPSYPTITVPEVDTVRLGNENIVKDDGDLTAENFCDLSYLWPLAKAKASPYTVPYEMKKVRHDSRLTTICIWMASLLFPGSFEDQDKSTKSLNTPSLLNREEFNTLLAKLARDSVHKRRLTLDMALPVIESDENFRRSYNALVRLLTGLVDREEMDPSRSYIYGAQKISSTLSSNRLYDPKTMVWYLTDESGPIFLHTEIDWKAYRQACSPENCEVTVPMRGTQRLFWALGIVGGVATIVLAVVTTLLWPCTAMLLLWISRLQTAAMVIILRAAMEIILRCFFRPTTAELQEGPGTPHVALVAGPQSVEQISES